MTDVHSKEVRSYNMSRIRSKNTTPEIIVRKFLFKNGFRFRLHDKKLPGRPDIVLAKYKTVIFIHGCFWHGHTDCRYFVIPKTRTEWWMNKIGTNKSNDSAAEEMLLSMGWRIIKIWECELKRLSLENTLSHCLRQLTQAYL